MTDLARYLPLVQKLARRHAAPNDFDDAVNDGLTAVWLGLGSYKDSEHGTLIGWLTVKTRWAIIDGQRARSGWRRFPHVEVLTLDGRGEPAANRLDDPERRAVVGDAVRRTRRQLSDADRALFDDLIAGRTQAELARIHGVTQGRISQRVRKIRQQLNENL